MIKKTIGYILAVVGIIGIVISSEGARKALSIQLPSTINNNLIIIVSLIIVAVGLSLAIKSSGKKQPEEVPIYEGKNVVGYRRMGKK